MKTLEIMSACVEGTTQALIVFIDLVPFIYFTEDNEDKAKAKIRVDDMKEVLEFSKQALTYRNLNKRVYQKNGVIIQKPVLGLDTTKTVLYVPPKELEKYILTKRTLDQNKLDTLTKCGYVKIVTNSTRLQTIIEELNTI